VVAHQQHGAYAPCVLFASIPAAIIGYFLEDKIDALFYNKNTIAIALIVYGVLFILIEVKQKNATPAVTEIEGMPWRTAFIIGLFQVLALIPGTSHSGATIIGALLIGTSRSAAAEFAFFLAIPVMFGASMLRLLQFGFVFSGTVAVVLLVGMLTAFAVSILAIKFLMRYIKNHSFTVFGWYRIVLGTVILASFLLSR
jgi:undecaprenyl-diphosphatase